MENINKNAKIIGIGNEGISNLESIYSVVKENVDTEKININQDVDKEYVRQLLDGVDILLLTYSTEDKRAVDIVKAISFMAGERRVLSIGLNSSEKEHKEELGLNQEFLINEENCNEIMNIINLMIEAVSDFCMISIDLTDLKELFASEGGIKYSFNKFDTSKSEVEIAEE
ncbi:MAG: cell division protein, partial [Peptostreptococcaceae bacterium]|nr:cell division protein [Peptostreptococcaceae bacterium]